jgi:hypothetical protein
MGVSKVVYGSNTLIDLTGDTITAADLMQGKTAHGANGEPITGTYSGGSNWELVASAEVELNVTSTSTQNSLATLNVGKEVLKDNTYYLFSRVRDTAGARPGYWVGSDQLLVSPKSGSSWIIGGQSASIGYIAYICTSSGAVQASTMSAKYGVWVKSDDAIYGRMYYSGRYNSSGTLTINGTYSIEVYKLTLPDGKTPIPAVSTN